MGGGLSGLVYSPNMLKKLRQLSYRKPNLVFDFDKIIAQMEIDWSGWHTGIADVYAKYDVNHGYKQGEHPHEYYNALVNKHGEELVRDVQRFVAGI